MPLQSRTLPVERGSRRSIGIDVPNSRRKSNRENIEAELVCLRSRKFVRQESERISPRAASADEVISGPFQDHRRRCTRRGMVESIREVARKAKVFEIRLRHAGRRSFWPKTADNGGSFCAERIEHPLRPAHGENRGVFLWQHRKKDVGDVKRVASNQCKRKHGKTKQSKPKELHDKRHSLQSWRPKGSHTADEEGDNQPEQRRQRMRPLQFWGPRRSQNGILPTDDEEDETVVVTPSLDDDVDTHAELEGEGNGNKKKNKPIIAAVIGGVATSTIGVVVAVILL